MLETNRCKMLNLQVDDYGDVKKLYFHKQVRKFLGGIVDNKKYDSSFRNMIACNGNSYYWVVRHLDANEFIGLVSLGKHHNDIDIEVSYQFMPKWWGYGYAEEALNRILEFAFEELKFKKIIAETQSANKASCKLLQMVGMKLEKSVQRFGAEQYIFSKTVYEKV